MDILNAAPFSGNSGGAVLIGVVLIIVVGVGLTIESVIINIGRFFGKQNMQGEVFDNDDDEEDEETDTLDEIKALLENQNKLLGEQNETLAEIRDVLVKPKTAEPEPKIANSGDAEQSSAS